MLPDTVEGGEGIGEHRAVQLQLVLEVVIDHGVVDACDLSDLARRGAFEPPSGEDRACRFQDRRPGVRIHGAGPWPSSGNGLSCGVFVCRHSYLINRLINWSDYSNLLARACQAEFFMGNYQY